MSVLPLELRNTTDGATAVNEIERAMRAARKRVARRATFYVIFSTVALPLAAAALWIILSRFTLLELPQWPAVLFIGAWLLAVSIVASSRHVTAGQCARYLDRTLGLDERLTTLLELARSTPLSSLSAPQKRVPADLLHDTAYQIKSNRTMMPGAWQFNLQKWQLVALLVVALALGLGLFVPTPLDAVRAERAAIEQRVSTELNTLAQLKAEIVTRPGLSDSDRQALVAELDKLQASLSSPGADREALLAALSDAQQQLQQISPQTSSDFVNILAAARTMEQAMVDVSQTKGGGILDLTWSPTDFPGMSDLAIAANAAQTLSSQSKFLGSGLTRNTVSLLSRASTQAGSDDADLAQHLMDSSTAISAKDVEKAKDALVQTSLAFQADDRRWQLAQSVDKIMSNLDDGRQALAQIGADSARKPQVGFRRSAAQLAGPSQPGEAGTPSGTSTGDNQNGQGGQNASGTGTNGPSALGPQTAGSAPDYGSYKGGAGSSAGSGGAQNGQGGSQTGAGSGQPGAGGASQPGAGASGSGDSGQGTFTGPIAGPVGGGAGAISQVANPAGQGISDTLQPASSSDQQSDSIYIPPSGQPSGSESNPVGIPGQAAPEQPGAIPGRSSGSGDGPTTPSDLGQGTRNQIRTPYKQVIGDYVQQATQSLGSAYVPADAKQYVKDYFTALGK